MACIIAAPASGSGKTLVSLAVTAWARQRGMSLQPFKVGPDYLDAQLLSAAAGKPCRNLDTTLCGYSWVQTCFHYHAPRADLALVEGVMGLFDGVGSGQQGSTATIALLLNLPVILVVDGSGQAQSLAALICGFRDFDPRLRLAGVVVNRVTSKRHRQLLEEVLEGISMPMLGCLPKQPALELPSRHLGLAPAHELKDFDDRLDILGDLTNNYLDHEHLVRILRSSASSNSVDPIVTWATHNVPALNSTRGDLAVAVAEDEAFHFHYAETRECLEAIGITLITWSPLADEKIPRAAGLFIPGGFPEQHAARLSTCHRSLGELRRWFRRRPLYAECGGMLLLGRNLCDLEDKPHPMAGLLPFEARRGEPQVGYRTMKPLGDGLLVRAGEIWRGHEFHHWQLSSEGLDLSSHQPKIRELWQVEGWRSKSIDEGWSIPTTLHASWVHLHWASCEIIPCRWRAAVAAVKVDS
ncbi:cobyrinate a,c-diamide synthase [cyanobiont of Ornithocercus magnificus]|nr:cobyrinate a,c-diamide synthase [cyanobiont of Ornithocercus magnificus]